MKKILLVLVAGFTLLQSSQKPMMGAYIDKKGNYSNPTSRLVDKVLSSTELGTLKKDWCNTFMALKSSLIAHIRSDAHLVRQFKMVKTTQDLKEFIQTLPNEAKSKVLATVQKMDETANAMMKHINTIKQSLLKEGITPGVMPLVRKFYRNKRSAVVHPTPIPEDEDVEVTKQ